MNQSRMYSPANLPTHPNSWRIFRPAQKTRALFVRGPFSFEGETGVVNIDGDGWIVKTGDNQYVAVEDVFFREHYELAAYTRHKDGTVS